jgi:hypothetical protein
MYENNTSLAVGARLPGRALSWFLACGNPGFEQLAAV